MTHHSPTFDRRANNPRYERSERSCCFVTDLSGERCWISLVVKCWAFSHTHFSCCYRDEVTGKLVIANQGGYNPLVGFNPQGNSRKRVGKFRVVEARGETWELLPNQQRVESPEKKLGRTKIEVDHQMQESAKKKRSW